MLTVGRWQPGSADLVAALRTEEAATRAAHDYSQVRLAPVTCSFVSCAEWEYLYTAPDGTGLHVVERAFRTRTGHTYLIVWRTKAFDWSINLSNYLPIVASFRETGDGYHGPSTSSAWSPTRTRPVQP